MKSGRNSTPPHDWRIIAALLGVAGLARAALGIQIYPYGDDMVYGPLARLSADPGLYPGDAQLHSFQNHAWVYSAIWRAAEATVGVAPVHLALTLALTGVSALLVLAIMRACGAAGWFAPLAFLVAAVAQMRGIGRGAYGGVIGDHFHLQSVAAVLALAAFLAVLRSRWIVAGVLLGLAALTQPALAAQAAAAAGCGALAMGRRGLRPLVVMAAVSMIVAIPMAVKMWGAQSAPLDMGAREVIETGYLWRAAHHYLIPVAAYLVFTLYFALGLTGGALNRRAGGVLAGLAVFGLLSLILYSDPLGLGLDRISVIPYMLDLSRSSPLLWLFGAAMGAAALERAVAARDWRRAAAPAAVGLVIVAVNYDFGPIALAALGAAILVALSPRFRTGPLVTGAALAGAGATVWAISVITPPLDRDQATKGFYEWAAADTAPDALFIAPPFVADIRELAGRPVWVDFRAVSMAQPDQTMLSRRRLEAITPDYQNLPETGGWDGAYIWTLAYTARHDADSIKALLRQTGATYFVTYTTEDTADLAGDGLKIAYGDENVIVFRLSAND